MVREKIELRLLIEISSSTAALLILCHNELFFYLLFFVFLEKPNKIDLQHYVAGLYNRLK